MERNDENTTVSYLKEQVKKFCEERDWDQFHDPKDLAIVISTEANELLDIFRFKNDKDMQEILKDQLKREHVGEELAYVFYFTLRFAQMNNFDLTSELLKKLAKNAQRYLIEKSKGSNKKYKF
ncbi:MAG: nucleotide pyrophosphohydrolase [Caldisphaera sp.]